jgi:hypothetical protein
MTERSTTLTRAYLVDQQWIMKHRGTGNSADAIHNLIKFFEASKDLLKNGGLT